MGFDSSDFSFTNCTLFCTITVEAELFHLAHFWVQIDAIPTDMNIGIELPEVNPLIILQALELKPSNIWNSIFLKNLTDIESEFTEQVLMICPSKFTVD